MALNINILSAIDWTSGLGRKFRRKEGEASTIRETIIVQSNAQFENLVGRFDLSDRKMTVVDCGHTPFIHWKQSERKVVTFSGESMPLGFGIEDRFEAHEFHLEIGDVLIFYTEKMELLSQSSIQSSQTYPYIHLWGPFAVEGLGMAIPFFKDLFTDLTDFFEAINKNKG